MSPLTALPPPFVAHVAEFEAVVGDDPALVRVARVPAHEGPVYLPAEDALAFTTLPRPRAGGRPLVAIARLDLEGGRWPLAAARGAIVRLDANAANGMTLAADGTLLVCEQGGPASAAAIARVDPASGERETVVDAYAGLPLNSPNDVVRRSDGTIWFTDPSYGHLQGFRPEPRLPDAVYRYDPRSRELSVVADSLDKPNGLAFSPDERVLYVADSGANHEPGSYDPARPHELRAFDVLRGRELANERRLRTIEPGFPDGVKVDADGRVYVSSASGVQVLDPDGELLGEIALPGVVNFAFGGPRRDVLLMTADDAVWAARLEATAATPEKGA